MAITDLDPATADVIEIGDAARATVTVVDTTATTGHLVAAYHRGNAATEWIDGVAFMERAASVSPDLNAGFSSLGAATSYRPGDPWSIRGTIFCSPVIPVSASGSGALLFTLPAGDRPASDIAQTGFGFDNTSTDQTYKLFISATSGEVRASGLSGVIMVLPITYSWPMS